MQKKVTRKVHISEKGEKMLDHFHISEKMGKNGSFGCICKKKDRVNKNTIIHVAKE